MTNTTKSKIALALGIAGLVSNLLLLSFSGAPMSIACGIMGIAFALTTIEDKQLPKMSKIALILSIIALFFGILLFAVISFATSVMSDPDKSHQLIEYIEQIIGGFPEDVQEQIHSMYGI